jgi:hypothetical protein
MAFEGFAGAEKVAKHWNTITFNHCQPLCFIPAVVFGRLPDLHTIECVASFVWGLATKLGAESTYVSC